MAATGRSSGPPTGPYLIQGPALLWVMVGVNTLSVCLSGVYAPAHTLGGGRSGSANSLSHSRGGEACGLFWGRGREGALFLADPLPAEEQLTEQFVISTLAAWWQHLPRDGLGIVCQADLPESLLSARAPLPSTC